MEPTKVYDSDLYKRYSTETEFDVATLVLHLIARHGYQPGATPHGFQPTTIVPIGLQHLPAIMLVNWASYLVARDKKKLYDFKFDTDTGSIQMGFPKDAFPDKPPVHMMLLRLETAKQILQSHISLSPDENHYIVRNPADLPFNFMDLSRMFTDSDHPPIPLYALPEGKQFVDSHTYRREGEVIGDVMLEYLHKEGKPADFAKMQPSALMIDSAVMERMMEELQLGIEKGRQPS